MALLLAVCSSLVFGVADFLGGMSARRIAALVAALVANVVGLVLVALLAPVIGGDPAGGDIALGVGAGVVGSVALALFYFGLSRGAMIVVAPISALSAAVVPLLVGLALGEVPGALQWVGIAMALPAVVLIAREGTAAPAGLAEEPVEEQPVGASNRLGVLCGLGAGIGFGTFIVLITRTSADSGLWPLVTSRSASSVVLGVMVLATGALAASRGGDGAARAGWLLAVGAGVLDGSSNVLIMEAGRRGMLVLVGVVGALYPASTILLARVVLGERLQRHQVAGLGLAVAAVVLIAT